MPVTNRPLRVFVAAVDLAALISLVFVPAAGLLRRPGLLALLLVLGMVAGALRIRVPRARSHVSAVEPFVFCALLVIGPWAACLVAVSAVVGAALRRPPKVRPLQFLFNLGVATLSTALCALVYGALGGAPGASLGSLLLPLVGAAAIYFLVNTVLVSVVVALEQSRAASFDGWLRSFFWTLPTNLVGLALGVAMIALLSVGIVWSLILAAAACWLLVTFVRVHSEGLDAEP